MMFKIFGFYPVATLCTLALMCGCGKNREQPLKPVKAPVDPAPDYVVAMVNGTPLVFEDMNRRAMGFLKDDVKTNHLIIPKPRMEEAKEVYRKKAIRAFVYKTVLLDEATKNNIKVFPKDRERGLKGLEISLKSRHWTTNDFFNNGPMPPAIMHKEFEDSLIMDKYINSQISKKITLGKDDVKQMTDKLNASNEAKRIKLEEIRKQLIAGADFAEMAKKYSDCKTASKGGDLGEFGRGKMVKAFEDAAFSQKVGEIGPVISTPYGYHIIKVTAHSQKKDATDSTPAIPETVRASHILLQRTPVIKKKIIETLQKERYQEESKKLYRSLLKKADVKCFLYDDIQF